MKQKFHSLSLLLFLLYLITFSRTSARSLATKQGADEQHNQGLKGVSLSKSEDNEATDVSLSERKKEIKLSPFYVDVVNLHSNYYHCQMN